MAGKDVVAKYLQTKYSVFHIKFSSLLDEVLNIFDLPISRRNEIDLGLGLRKVFGEDVLFRALRKRVLGAEQPVIIVNGIRMDEFPGVKNLGAKIIYITAPIELRFERYNYSHEKTDDAVMSFEEFKAQEKEATEVNIPNLGKQADFKIENTGALPQLYARVDEVVKSIKE